MRPRIVRLFAGPTFAPYIVLQMQYGGIENRIYVIGGFDGQGRLVSEIHCFSLKTNAWTKVSCGCSEGRAYSSACTVNVVTQLYTNSSFRAKIGREGIYMFGGMTASGASGTLAILSKYKAEHVYGTPKTEGKGPCPRYQHTMNYCEVLNALVVFGGRNDSMLKYWKGSTAAVLNDMYMLTLDVMTWVRVDTDPEPERRAKHSADIVGDTIYIFGGVDESLGTVSTGFFARLCISSGE